jgi:probable rRNA maturation factor
MAPALPAGPSGRRRTPVTQARLGIRFVAATEGRALNREFRHKDYATNVLSFVYETGATVEADLAICLPVLTQEAKRQGKTLRQHLAHLVIHGVLHALGYDHVSDRPAERMQALEIAILASLRIPDPYPSMAQAAAVDA